jgi:hypothetical protein
MATTENSALQFPFDPLDKMTLTVEDRRRQICGVLESYNGTYDMLIEAVQNAVDSVEDAAILQLSGARATIAVTVNLAENWLSVMDTGIGMTPDQVAQAFVPGKSFKVDPAVIAKRGAAKYRGYKGVGLTFLAYGTDDIVLHSKKDGILTKGRMQYGRKWATGDRPEVANVARDEEPSPLDSLERGTYLRVTFSPSTRPKSLNRLASNPRVWETILRTRTAIGQILLNSQAVTDLQVKLTVIDSKAESHQYGVEPEFHYPHLIQRKPPFRFLDLVNYWTTHGQRTKPSPDQLRQDGLYLIWDSERIKTELTDAQAESLGDEIKNYSPHLYAFVPYQGSIWGELNSELTGVKNRNHIYPGLILAVNRQRLADKLEIEASRFETFSRNVLVVVHFENAKPDQGRKTVQDEVTELARRAADRAVQYLAKQRDLLKPAGEAPTPGQREVEKDHADWLYNVRTHAKQSPIDISPLTFVSEPLTEQDVVALFHQLTVMDLFPGIKIFATSQSATYDCLVQFDCPSDSPGLKYVSIDESPLGVSPYVLGSGKQFSTRHQTVEFKNNLDGLVDEFGRDTKKSYGHIDICVCWGKVSDKFEGYQLTGITESNIDRRGLPGVTHLLERDGDTHVIQIIMLKNVINMIKTGKVQIAAQTEKASN